MVTCEEEKEMIIRKLYWRSNYVEITYVVAIIKVDEMLALLLAALWICML